ncbi:hypothetical protein GCM10022293_56930 [Azospirillum formosense]
MHREGNMDQLTAPTLSEILDEPIIVALMNRDGMTAETLRQLLEQVGRNLRDREDRLAA